MQADRHQGGLLREPAKLAGERYAGTWARSRELPAGQAASRMCENNCEQNYISLTEVQHSLLLTNINIKVQFPTSYERNYKYMSHKNNNDDSNTTK
jgi:hypothetical protein